MDKVAGWSMQSPSLGPLWRPHRWYLLPIRSLGTVLNVELAKGMDVVPHAVTVESIVDIETAGQPNVAPVVVKVDITAALPDSDALVAERMLEAKLPASLASEELANELWLEDVDVDMMAIGETDDAVLGPGFISGTLDIEGALEPAPGAVTVETQPGAETRHGASERTADREDRIRCC